MKRVIFIAHGVGDHDEGWSKPVVEAIKDIVSALESDEETGFDADRLQ